MQTEQRLMSKSDSNSYASLSPSRCHISMTRVYSSFRSVLLPLSGSMMHCVLHPSSLQRSSASKSWCCPWCHQKYQSKVWGRFDTRQFERNDFVVFFTVLVSKKRQPTLWLQLFSKLSRWVWMMTTVTTQSLSLTVVTVQLHNYESPQLNEPPATKCCVVIANSQHFAVGKHGDGGPECIMAPQNWSPDNQLTVMKMQKK